MVHKRSSTTDMYRIQTLHLHIVLVFKVHADGQGLYPGIVCIPGIIHVSFINLEEHGICGDGKREAGEDGTFLKVMGIHWCSKAPLSRWRMGGVCEMPGGFASRKQGNAQESRKSLDG